MAVCLLVYAVFLTVLGLGAAHAPPATVPHPALVFARGSP